MRLWFSLHVLRMHQHHRWYPYKQRLRIIVGQYGNLAVEQRDYSTFSQRRRVEAMATVQDNDIGLNYASAS